jgi:hypothetical protein
MAVTGVNTISHLAWRPGEWGTTRVDPLINGVASGVKTNVT